MKKQKYHF